MCDQTKETPAGAGASRVTAIKLCKDCQEEFVTKKETCPRCGFELVPVTSLAAMLDGVHSSGGKGNGKGRWIVIISNSAAILLLLASMWLVLNNYRYGDLIREREAINQRYSQLVDQIDVQTQKSTQEFQELRSRFRNYLDRLEKTTQ